jgi:cyanophycinase-like exopeptidase
LNAKNVGILTIRREQAADEEVLTRLKAADIVMFTGGDQLRLTSILEEQLFMIFYWISITMRNLFMLVHQQSGCSL